MDLTAIHSVAIECSYSSLCLILGRHVLHTEMHHRDQWSNKMEENTQTDRHTVTHSITWQWWWWWSFRDGSALFGSQDTV